MWRFKNKRVQFIQIDVAYTDYLRKHIDLRIPAEHRESVSEMRPFIGILMTHDDIEYVIPLTSPKDKHKNMKNTMDFHKINGGKWGAINFNNMFPVLHDPSVYKIIRPLKDVNTYSNLLINQISWLNKTENREMVLKKAEKLYEAYVNDTLQDRIKKRCCDFKKLEKHYKEYITQT